MPRSRSPFDHSKYEGDSRRERSMSISSRGSSSDREHSPMPYKKRKTDHRERLSRDREKSGRSVRSLYRHDEHKSRGGDYSSSDFDNYKDSIFDMEESVDPSICNFRGSTLQDDILEPIKSVPDDRLKRLEKMMSKIVQNSRMGGRTPSEQSGRHYGSQEHDSDHSNSRLKNLEKMIEKMIKSKTETSTFTVPTEPNGPVTLEELIPLNSNFTTSMWLAKINEECLERSFNEKTCIKFLESKMTGSVKSWYKTIGSNDLSWPELKMLIIQTFPDNSEFASTLRLLVNRFKKPEETIAQYYFSKMYLIEACRISGVSAVSCLIDGLKDPKIQREAKASNFLTPESLYSHFLGKLSHLDGPNNKGKMDRSDRKGEMDRPSHRGEMDRPSHKGEMDRPSHKSEMDLPSHRGEMDRPSHKGEMDRPSHKGEMDRPSHRGEMDRPSHKGEMDRPSRKGEMDRPSHKGEMDRLSHKGEMDRPSHKGEMDRLSHRGEMDRLSHRGEMDRPSHKEMDWPYRPNDQEKVHPGTPNFANSHMEHPTHLKVDPTIKLERLNSRLGRPDFNEEFRIAQLDHHHFRRDYGMGQSPPTPNFGMVQPPIPNFGMVRPPSPPSFRMEPNYGMEPWHPNPYYEFENRYPIEFENRYPIEFENRYPSHLQINNESSRYMGEQPMPKCSKCFKMGHSQHDCRTICFVCQERGHIASSCPIKKADVLAEKKTLKESEKPNKSEKQ